MSDDLKFIDFHWLTNKNKNHVKNIEDHNRRDQFFYPSESQVKDYKKSAEQVDKAKDDSEQSAVDA